VEAASPEAAFVYMRMLGLIENNEDELAEIAGGLLRIIHASGYQADAVVV
jgi:hypothetical protein